MAGRLPDIPDQYDSKSFRRFVQDIEKRLTSLGAAVGVYSVTNYVETRTLDAGAATTTDVANFVATLVADLQAAGKLGK